MHAWRESDSYAGLATEEGPIQLREHHMDKYLKKMLGTGVIIEHLQTYPV